MERANPEPIDSYLEQVWKLGGTDLLLTAGAPPLVRVDGVIGPIENAKPLTPSQLDKLVTAIFTKEMDDRFNDQKSIDFSFNWRGEARFRANAFRQRGSIGLAVRLIPYRIPSLEELGLPEAAQRLVGLRQGLVLVTGPTGSGKSTTLAAMIDRINDDRPCHILTIEDPIEYVHKHKRAAVNQREIGEDTPSFHHALRSALREDPDVLLVGEMRDLETIRTVLTIAETGHLVFGTLHANDTGQAIDRIIDVFPAEQQQQIRVQLASTLAAIIYQQLLPRAGGGRVAAFEVLIANFAIKNLIRENKTRQIRNIVATTSQEGMQTFESHLSALVQSGLVPYEDAAARSLYPNDVQRKPAQGSVAPVERGGRFGRRR